MLAYAAQDDTAVLRLVDQSDSAVLQRERPERDGYGNRGGSARLLLRFCGIRRRKALRAVAPGDKGVMRGSSAVAETISSLRLVMSGRNATAPGKRFISRRGGSPARAGPTVMSDTPIAGAPRMSGPVPIFTGIFMAFDASASTIPRTFSAGKSRMRRRRWRRGRRPRRTRRECISCVASWRASEGYEKRVTSNVETGCEYYEKYIEWNGMNKVFRFFMKSGGYETHNPEV